VKKKPSSCLKEVEKIKLKREERRAAQQALREQQDLEYDTSAPNWEFGAMIRSDTSHYVLDIVLLMIPKCGYLSGARYK